MTAIVRMYESEHRAREAMKKLVDADVEEAGMALVNPAAGAEAEVVKSAVDDGRIPALYSSVCLQALRQGRTVLSVKPPVLGGQIVKDIMDSCDPVDTGSLPAYEPRMPDPLSQFLGIPTLSNRGARWGEVRRFRPLFGQGIIPWKRPWTTSFGIPLLTKPKRSWTSSFGLPLLSKPKRGPWKSSFGFPMLTKKGKPILAKSTRS